MNKAVDVYKAGNTRQARVFVDRSVRCLNLDAEPAAIRPLLGLYAALYLKETFDQMDIPPLEEIPDAEAVEAQKLTAWTVPYTEITIASVKDGPAGGRFLFSPETVKRSEEFFDEVKILPYKPGAQGALYKQLTSSAGPIVSKKLTDRLPRWARTEIFGRAVLQWIGFDLYFLVTVGAVLVT